MFDKELLKLIKGKGRYIAYSVAVMLCGTLANVGITASICWAIWIAVSGQNAISYLYAAIAALICIVLRYAATRLVSTWKTALGAAVKDDLRKKTYQKILSLGTVTQKDMSHAALTQISMEGIEQLDLYYSSYLPQLFYSMLVPIMLFAVCVPIDWRTSLVLLVCVPLIPLSIVAVSKYAKKIFSKYWSEYTSMGDDFLDSVQGMKELKIFKAETARRKKMNESAERFRKITMKVLVMQLASTTIMDLVAYGGAGAGIALAVTGAAMGWIAPVSALFLVLTAVEFFLPLRALGSAFHVAMNGASAGGKIMKLLQTPDPVWGDEEVEGTNIEIKNVSFSYDGIRKVLDDVTFVFARQGMTGIVGESGCGKSTTVELITGALRASEGTISIGGKPLQSLSRSGYYGRLAVVSYNTYIFNDTLRNNFLSANKEASEEDMFAALAKVNLEMFAREVGLDKVITEDANNISGGQKQRLALAIHLTAPKDIYIFDEATSNIDTESEAIIMKNIKELSERANVIVISHRLANVSNADRIYLLDDGKLCEQGKHQELLEKGGKYAYLYHTQTALEKGYSTYAKREA